MTPVPRIIVFFHLVLIVYSFPNVEYIRDTCSRRCESSLIYSSRDSGFFCDKDCSVLQCHDGCDVFPDVLNSTCSQACSDGIQQKINATGQTVTQDEIKNCVQGCVFALDEYADSLSGLLTPMPQPTLVRNSKNYSSVFLQWQHVPVENVTYVIHKKVIETNVDWQFHKEFEFFEPDKIKVMRLHPYVTYEFKLLALVTPLPRHVFESPPTVPITTLAHGVPSTAPKILRLSAPSPTVISLYWAAPVFPNGPLLGYRINLNPVGHAELKQTTLEVPPNVTSWTFSQCQSSQLYVFFLSAWNTAGEGPADVGNITTPNPGNLSASETPYLVLGAENKVIKSNILDTASVPDTVTTESPGKTIKGIGVHVRRQLIVMSDSDEQVSIISLTGDHTQENLYPSILSPTAISVDWLADQVYIASHKRIYNCPLDRDMCFVAIDNLVSTPTDVKVDPVNGYLYFALHGTGGGLYRVDLSLIHRTAKPKPVHIISVNDLSAFIVDFDNIQLFFPKFLANTSVDTIMSSFLDGSNMKDFRPNVVVRAFNGITSLIYYDGAFIWTNGKTVWCEEFDPGFSAFRHNTMLFFEKSFSGLNLFHPKAQPTPVPLTTPMDVEVLFTPNRAQIRWQPPPRLQYQGMGAWSKWTYNIELQDVLDNGNYGHFLKTAETSSMNHTVAGLTPNTTYHVRVRAKSEAGTGPWSTYFVGRTLQQEAIPVRVLMGVPGMIIEKDLSQLTHTTVVNFLSEPVDLSWHGDLLLWTTVNGALYVYNRRSDTKIVLNINHAYSVAYDWLGGKIFWSEPKLGVIRRSDRRGIFPEFIYQAEARDIAVDSLHARLYWATTNSIDSAYLNGENHVEIFSVPFFSGRHVISLALNFDLGKVMWYVKGYDSQELYMADLIGVQGKSALEVLATVRSAGSFHSISQTSGLQYYSHRLFWVDGVNALVVGDMQCNYTSVVAPFNNVTSFAVAHPSMQDYPAGMSEDSVFVIPEKIEHESIRTVGHWSDFNLTWSSDTQVNHGTLFYKLYLKIGRQQIHKTMSDTWYNVKGYSPFIQMVVSLQPYTYWGYADAVTLSIRSPMSKPTAPQTPRVYVTQHKNASTSQHSLAADFRWSTPLVTNGILSHHFITYWQSGHKHEAEAIQVPGTSRHFILTPLSASGTYYFQVVACTDAGCGPESELVSATTDSVNPVPKLMIAMASGVSVSEFDSDLNTSVLLPQVSTSALAYLAQDNRTFWIEHSDSLYVSQNSQQKELVEMTGVGLDLAMDWISRTLYVVENRSSGNGTHSIMGYHMDQDLYQAVITTQNRIGSVISDPYTSMLLWSEIDNQGLGRIMSAPLGTEESNIILGKGARDNNSRKKRSLPYYCSCTELINVSPVIAMDYTKQGKTEVIFVDVKSNTILASDINGCNCSEVYTPPPGQVNGLPPSLLAVDHLRVYWYNRTEGRLYSINKDTRNNFQTQYLPGVQDIIAYGSHLQPLPDSDCLDPGAYSGMVSARNISNTSVTLDLQPVKRPEQCRGISVPQDKFTVYYRKWLARSGFQDCNIVPDDCMKKEVYSTKVEITDLEPYTEYMVQVAVSNYYTEYLAEAMSKPKTFTTRPGVPYSPQDVEAIPASPEEILVKWLPPTQLNGPASDVYYVIHFSTVTKEGRIMQQTENQVLNVSKDLKLERSLKDLEVNHTYDIKVQACMKSIGLCNDSVVVQARTYNVPNNITFLSATHDSVTVVWRSPQDNSISRHNFEYAELRDAEQSVEWKQRMVMPDITVKDMAYNETFTGLTPNTLYAFRCHAIYTTAIIRNYNWPQDFTQAMFKTLTWTPEEPLAPTVRRLTTGELAYEVMWEEPKDNGDQIQTYALQYCALTDNEWSVAYNGPEQRWVVDETLTRPGVQYVFRVAASNAKGWGPYSVNSSVFLAPPAVENGQNDVTIGAIVGVFVFVAIFMAVIIPACICARRQREEKKKQQLLVIRGPDTELANLRQHPQSTFLQSNTLYGLPFVPTDADIAALPHVCRDQLDLTQFLGSGAFGEVYEGVARDILADGSGPVRCAIKTLRKSASDHEKEEFLKEAVLMRNFQYDHILGLLGVCLDNDPHFIIMELMEGGDLLTFLRSSRATLTSPAKLMLPDLVKICVHVAKGCKYLEDKHFVHRDLAARNCLVSCSEPEAMVVKIGDFGLAREVYTQDYYRKVGEGLLPVRWMSPESLVDGVFTTQSDIWAFGVLMWEVLTLGQQPYPARTNIEVLHFVRAGGKLERPDKCTDEMFSLMQRCWSFSAEERPSFADLLQQLQMYEEKCGHMTQAEIALHSPTGADGGSERLTPASKKKRLVHLLGGAEDKEKLVVDIPGMGRSRTSSLDSKRSSVSESSRTAYSMAQFPAVREYDAMGYLEPRPRRVPQYLHLLNHAPELLLPEFQDGRAQAAGINPNITPQQQGNSASAFRPVGPYSHAIFAGGKNGGSMTRLGSNPPTPTSPCQQMSSPVPFMSNGSDGRRSSSSSQTYGVVSVQEPTVERLIVDLTDVSRIKASQRKFSDQDLYSSPAQYNQQRNHRLSSASSATSDHPYSRVISDDMNNNCNSSSGARTTPVPTLTFWDRQPLSHDGSLSRHLNYDGNVSRQANYDGMSSRLSSLEGNVSRQSNFDGNVSYSSIRSKGPSLRGNRSASESDSVFEEEEEYRYPPPYVNVQGQHGGRSRGQVYPENSNALAGFDITHVSLV